MHQTDQSTVVLVFYGRGQHALCVSVDPRYPRVYLASRRTPAIKPSPQLTVCMDKFLVGTNLVSIRQLGLDRILTMEFDSGHKLIIELLGKHSHLLLVSAGGNVICASKWIGPQLSKRPVEPGKPYVHPPFSPKRALADALPTDDLNEFEGVSPIVKQLLEHGFPLVDIQSRLDSESFDSYYYPGHGAYPLPLETLGLKGVQRASISASLEQHFSWLIEHDRVAQHRSSLLAQLKRVELAREVALAELAEAAETARNARAIQIKGELILAYQSQIESGDSQMRVWDYEGQPLDIPLKADQTPQENADRYFLKAKKAKSRASEIEGQIARLEVDLLRLRSVIDRLHSVESWDDFEGIRSEADEFRWTTRSGEALPKEDRPFAGFSVKEFLSPGGWRVLCGTNATANDYLTTKLSRPSDLWFHVRGATSAHVVLCTNNQPSKVQRADLEFAAQVAVNNSSSKHSSFVSVDYTERRHVRKPRGASPGTAVYTREKTIHVHA